MSDVTERSFWPRYMAVYQDIVRHTSTKFAPWYVVPSDHKWFARVVIGSVIVSALQELNLRFPRVDKGSRDEFARVRKALESEGQSATKRTVRIPAKNPAKNRAKGHKQPNKAG